ncbi:MAG: nuclear transport factor 2 family protein [Bacteroidales bacterium]|nr:nuclear transport factor 2 family protein [Bacteroidales bacterium]
MILSCTKIDKNYSDGILLKTDSDFSALSVKEGMFRAFLAYIADDGVILRDGAYPGKGKKALEEYYSGKSDSSFMLSWEPRYEKISAGGDMGYTYGVWTNRIRSSKQVSRGTYVTIWLRQDDGSWKFVLDSGTQGLPGEAD